MTESTVTEASSVHAATAGDLMHPGVISCSRQATASELAELMIAKRIHCVAVMSTSPNGRHDPVVWGIVSDLDLLAAATHLEGPVLAEDLASQPVIQVRGDASAEIALQAMVAHHTNHLVVVDPERLSPIGIVSSTDLLALIHPQGGAHV